MTVPIVIDCDPGHDDAIAILLALASPEVELAGVTTVAGNQTLDKTTRNALVTLEVAGRSDIPVAVGAEAPLRRDLRTAAHVHRSEEHTSELQSRRDLVCRLLLEKKKKKQKKRMSM